MIALISLTDVCGIFKAHAVNQWGLFNGCEGFIFSSFFTNHYKGKFNLCQGFVYSFIFTSVFSANGGLY